MKKINKTPFFTIVTPTWNRANYLNRVYKGVKKQTYKDFEWIICDDGSTDNTCNVVNSIIDDADFPVILFKADVRIGKARMDNLAISEANGELIIFNDSDDFLVEQALENISNEWLEVVEKKDFNDFFGVTALCSTNGGNKISKYSEKFPRDLTLTDIRNSLRVKGDMLFAVRSSIMKNYIFPEVDYYIPESVVWSHVGVMMTRVIDRPLLIKEYNSKNCVSFSGKMQYNKGYAYSISKGKSLESINIIDRSFMVIKYIRYCIHGDIEFSQMVYIRPKSISTFILYFFYLIAYMLALTDIIQGKVIKTHIDFNKAVREAVIVKNIYNK